MVPSGRLRVSARHPSRVCRGAKPLCRGFGAFHPHLCPLPSRERDAYTEVQEGTSCRRSEEPVSKPFVPVNIETQDYEWG